MAYIAWRVLWSPQSGVPLWDRSTAVGGDVVNLDLRAYDEVVRVLHVVGGVVRPDGKGLSKMQPCNAVHRVCHGSRPPPVVPKVKRRLGNSVLAPPRPLACAGPAELSISEEHSEVLQVVVEQAREACQWATATGRCAHQDFGEAGASCLRPLPGSNRPTPCRWSSRQTRGRKPGRRV